MPKSINVMTQDLLHTLDPSITEVQYVKGGGYLGLKFDFGESIFLMEQDLVTLHNFLKQKQLEDK